jgi:hypothetical protein
MNTKSKQHQNKKTRQGQSKKQGTPKTLHNERKFEEQEHPETRMTR